MRTVYLPAIDKRVTLAAYLRFVRLAREKPDRQFAHGLTCWWPCTGAEIMRQFREGMHDRISQAVPYSRRGRKEA